MTAPPVRDWSTPREAGTLFLRGRTVRTALPIAAVVGTLLSAVNQGVIITGGDADTTTWIRVTVPRSNVPTSPVPTSGASRGNHPTYFGSRTRSSTAGE